MKSAWRSASRAEVRKARPSLSFFGVGYNPLSGKRSLPEAPEDMSAFHVKDAKFRSFFSDIASYNGKIYGVPLFRGQGSLFYNTDMFEAAGLKAPPKTTEEYNEYAKVDPAR